MKMMNSLIAMLLLVVLLVTTLVPVYAQEEESEKNTEASGSLLKNPVELSVYPTRLDPSTYPEDARRTYKALTWDAFNGVTQFVAGRNLPKYDDDLADVKGIVYRPNLGSVNDAGLKRGLQYAAANDLIIHNIGGFGPGSKFQGSFGEYIVSETQLEWFKKYVGDKFTGFDVGEQDGRFNFTYAGLIDPYIRDRVEQYIASQPYFDRVAADQGNWCSSLSVLWYWHYLLKEGYVILAGAETQNKITNGQVQYAFIRGAGKQYGVLPYGDIAVFDTWGHKAYGDVGETYNPDHGTSVSLMRRSFYTQYMYGSTILSMEQGWCYGGWAENQGELTPLGIMQNDCADFVAANGHAGEMVTPVGVLLDFYSGWMPARHIAGQFKVWNGMDYEAGDYLSDRVISMIYPDYEDSGFFRDETGAITNTPYGEIMDGLLSDARLETLKQYPVIVAAGDLFSMTEELSDKLHDYVAQGGTLFITAENAARLFPEWEISNAQRIAENSTVSYVRTGETVTESCSFDLYSAKLPGNADVVMTVNGQAAMADISMGDGRVLLSLTPYGLNAEAQKYNDPGSWFGPGIDKDLGRPYNLLTHVEAMLDEVFTSVMPVSVGSEELGVVTTRLEDNKYRVCVYNVLRESIPFEITSNLGEIEKIVELSTGTELFDAEGWWPNSLQPTGENLNDEANIHGGDVRLFDLYLKAEDVTVMEEIPQPAAVEKIYLCTDTLADTQENIRRFPTFFDHFSGVVVPARVLINSSEDGLMELNEWFYVQKLEIVANLNGETLTEEENAVLMSRQALLYGDDLVVNVTGEGWHEADGLRILQANTFDADKVYRALKAGEIEAAETAEAALVCNPENSNRILSLPNGAKDILDFVAECDGFYDIFGGVAVPGEYLFNRSDEALQAESEKLKAAGIKVVLDLTEEINHYPGRTLIDAVPTRYNEDMAFYRDCIRKLAILGGELAIFTTHVNPEAHYPSDETLACMQRTIAKLAAEAEPQGVRILLANNRFRMANTVVDQRRILNNIGAENVDLCLNLNHAQAGIKNLTRSAGDELAAIILGAPGSNDNATYLPVAQSTWKAEDLNDLENVVLIEKSRPFSWEQTLEDADYMNWR